jgi:protocatechuate 3,4-dioxygenase beta subunit
MNKREFLKTAGILGASSLIPFGKVIAGHTNDSQNAPQACTLIPSETAGPFPLDLTDNTFYFRKDVREDRTGTKLTLRMKIIGAQNCSPMQNVRVNIWHCDKDGVYSGYASMGTAGQTWLRGYQMTDVNGEVEFITIFPGWYPGRICHIHFQVYVNSQYAAISQLAYIGNEKNNIYALNSTLYTKGDDPMSIEEDGVFADGYKGQIGQIVHDSANNTVASFLGVTVQGSGTSGVGYQEMQNAKQFTLGQNFPNPYIDATTIPLTLKQQSDVTIELWDLNGKKLTSIDRKGLGLGDHAILIEPKALGLVAGSYVYQLEVRNNDGIFRDSKMMTAR